MADPLVIAGFYGVSALGGLGLWGDGALAGGELTTLGLATTVEQASVSLASSYSLSAHAIERMAERGFTRKMVDVTIRRGTRHWDPKNGTVNYVLREGFASGKNAIVGMNPWTNVVTTVIRSGRVLARLIPF